MGYAHVALLRRALPAALVAVVVTLAAGCSLVEMPSNRVLAQQPQNGSTPSAAPSASTSAPAAGNQPVWVQALGANVVVMAPTAAVPGHASPGAAVSGYIDALDAAKLTTACLYDPPSAQADCRAAMAQATTDSQPTMTGFALGYVAIDGSRALVGTTGTFCSPNETPECSSNSDPAAIFSTAKSFATLWAESVAADSSPAVTYSLAPCVKVGSRWYIYNPGPGGNS